jgi:hypothetical protein
MESVCWFCNGVLVEWLPQDIPFYEHGHRFPDCVYLNYLKGLFIYQECLKYKERYLTTVTRDSQTDEMMDTSHNNVIKKKKKSYLSFSLVTLLFL